MGEQRLDLGELPAGQRLVDLGDGALHRIQAPGDALQEEGGRLPLQPFPVGLSPVLGGDDVALAGLGGLLFAEQRRLDLFRLLFCCRGLLGLHGTLIDGLVGHQGKPSGGGENEQQRCEYATCHLHGQSFLCCRDSTRPPAEAENRALLVTYDFN